MSEHPKCPHCGTTVNMDDCDIYQSHVTYWGDQGPKPHTCWSCDANIYLDERVHRHWMAGRTPEEARDV